MDVGRGRKTYAFGLHRALWAGLAAAAATSAVGLVGGKGSLPWEHLALMSAGVGALVVGIMALGWTSVVADERGFVVRRAGLFTTAVSWKAVFSVRVAEVRRGGRECVVIGRSGSELVRFPDVVRDFEGLSARIHAAAVHNRRERRSTSSLMPPTAPGEEPDRA